jgi:hypothetical protein
LKEQRMHVLRFFVSILIPALPAAAVCPTTVELGERLIPSTVTVLADGDGGQTIDVQTPARR